MRISDWSSDVCSSDLWYPSFNWLSPDQTGIGEQESGRMTDNQDQPIRAEDLASAARLTAARYDPGTGDLHAVAKQVVEERFGSAGTKAAQDISPEEWINEVAQCRSKERRVGKECVSTGRSRGSRYQ